MVHDATAAGEPTTRRVLIADDNSRVRQELRTLLPLACDVVIVGEAADGGEAIRLAEALRPEVVLMDLEMPELDFAQGNPALLCFFERDIEQLCLEAMRRLGVAPPETAEGI